MQTLEEWRKESKPRFTLRIGRLSLLFQKFWKKAACGHPSPRTYVIEQIGRTLPREARLRCPQCQLAFLTEKYDSLMKMAVPCASCGCPIWENGPVCICTHFVWARDPEWPLFTTEEGYQLACLKCSVIRSTPVNGWWDGKKAVLVNDQQDMEHLSSLVSQYVLR